MVFLEGRTRTRLDRDVSSQLHHIGRKGVNIPKSWYLTPYDISLFAFCPSYLNYYRDDKPPIELGNFLAQRWEYHNQETNGNVLFECFKEICKFSWLYRLKRGCNTLWTGIRSAIGIVLDLRSRQGLPIPTDITPLVYLCRNYHSNFLNTTFANPTHPNIPLLFSVGRGSKGEGVIFADILHGVTISDEGYSIIDFRLVDGAPAKYDTRRFFSDYTVLSRYWAFTESTKQKPYRYIIIYANPRHGSTVKAFTIFPRDSTLLLEGESNITYMIRGCMKGINYQSRSPYCNECKYRSKCFLEEVKND